MAFGIRFGRIRVYVGTVSIVVFRVFVMSFLSRRGTWGGFSFFGFFVRFCDLVGSVWFGSGVCFDYGY